jgi:hypothetical protein
MSLDPDVARRMLTGAELLPVVQAGLGEAKQIVDACLAGGVPALLGRDDHCTKGCSPKVMVLARAQDAGRVQAILHERWAALVATVDPEVKAAGVWREVEDGGEPPCPACGATAALVEGACPDCGLQLG